MDMMIVGTTPMRAPSTVKADVGLACSPALILVFFILLPFHSPVLLAGNESFYSSQCLNFL